MHSTTSTNAIVVKLAEDGTNEDAHQLLVEKISRNEKATRDKRNRGNGVLPLVRTSTSDSNRKKFNTDATETPLGQTPDSLSAHFMRSDSEDDESDNELSMPKKSKPLIANHAVPPASVVSPYSADSSFDSPLISDDEEDLLSADETSPGIRREYSTYATTVRGSDSSLFSSAFSPRTSMVQEPTASPLAIPAPTPEPVIEIPSLDQRDFVVINEIMSPYLEKLSAVFGSSWSEQERVRAFKMHNELNRLLTIINLQEITEEERVKAVGDLCFLFDSEIYQIAGDKLEKLQKKTWVSSLKNILSDYFTEHKFTLALVFSKLIEHEKMVQNGGLSARQKILQGINNTLTAVNTRLKKVRGQNPHNTFLGRFQVYFSHIYTYALAQLPEMFRYPNVKKNLFTTNTTLLNQKALQLFAASNTQANKVVQNSQDYRQYIYQYTNAVRESAVAKTSGMLKTLITEQPAMAKDFNFWYSQLQNFQRKLDLPRASAIDFASISNVSSHYLESLKNFIEQFFKGDSRWQLLAQKFQVELEKFKKQVENPASTTLLRLVAANEILEVFDHAIIVRVGNDLRELDKRTIVTEFLQAVGTGSFEKISIKDIFAHFRKNGEAHINGSIKNIISRLSPDEAADFVYYKNFTLIYYQLGSYIIRLWKFLMQNPRPEPHLQRIACKLMDALAVQRTTLRHMLIDHQRRMGVTGAIRVKMDESINAVNNALRAFDESILTYQKHQYQKELKPAQNTVEAIADPEVRAMMKNQLNATYDRLINGDGKEIFLEEVTASIIPGLITKNIKLIEDEIKRYLPYPNTWGILDVPKFFMILRSEMYALTETSDPAAILNKLELYVEGDKSLLFEFLKNNILHCERDLILANKILLILGEGIVDIDFQNQETLIKHALAHISTMSFNCDLDLWSSAVSVAIDALKSRNNEHRMIYKFMLTQCNKPLDATHLEEILLEMKRDDEELIKGKLAEIEREHTASWERQPKEQVIAPVPAQLQASQSSDMPATEYLKRFVTPLLTTYSPQTTFQSTAKITDREMPTQSRSCDLQSLGAGHQSPAPFRLTPAVTTHSNRNPGSLLTYSPRTEIRSMFGVISKIPATGPYTSVIRELKQEIDEIKRVDEKETRETAHNVRLFKSANLSPLQDLKRSSSQGTITAKKSHRSLCKPSELLLRRGLSTGGQASQDDSVTSSNSSTLSTPASSPRGLK